MLPRPATSLARAALVTAAALAATTGAAHAQSGGVSASSSSGSSATTSSSSAGDAASNGGASSKEAKASKSAKSSKARKAKRGSSAAKGRATNQRPSPSAVVRTGASRLSVRVGPTSTARVGTLRRDEAFRVRCQVNGTPATGKYGTSRIWNRVKLKNGRTGYVPDAATETSSKNALVAPYCGYPDPKPAATNLGQGRCLSVASVALDPAPATRAEFVAAAGPLAKASKETTGVPAAVTLAQGILESASGTLTAGANNYFGIKAQLVSPGVFRWGAQAVGCVHKPTNEVEGGRTVRQIGQFRMYPSMRESFDDHGLFLRQNSRYAAAFGHSDDPEKFAQAIHKAGYATDPSYSSLLIKLMNDKTLPLKGWDA
jgi:flagellum-specific peptidoglycan hydrolase FlgJ